MEGAKTLPWTLTVHFLDFLLSELVLDSVLLELESLTLDFNGGGS